ncbi:hypothetical protein ABI59_11345 [Acidobacteria bacterium Mor1]|nr:hypothetical protein ABI59_11345 [Acidobacteria bacterium Mor1]
MENKQDLSFAEHRLRNVTHSVLLVGGMLLLLAVVGYLFAGTKGLFFLGAIAAILFIVSPRVSPRLILRMYRARPLHEADAPYLVRVVEELARRANLERVPELYYVPSKMVNAFAVGTRDNAAIGLTDGILRTLNRRELTGVLAHEMSHVRSNDTRVMGLADMISRATNTLSMIGQFLLFLNLPLILTGRAAIPWLAVLLLILAPTVASLLQLALSRAREYDADLGAARLTGDPEGLASALAKLEQVASGWFERILIPGRRVPEPSMLRSHPRTEDRIRRLLSLPSAGTPAAAEVPATFVAKAPIESPWRSLGDIRVPRWHISGLGLWY